jgi:hypothetical protein
VRSKQKHAKAKIGTENITFLWYTLHTIKSEVTLKDKSIIKVSKVKRGCKVKKQGETNRKKSVLEVFSRAIQTTGVRGGRGAGNTGTPCTLLKMFSTQLSPDSSRLCSSLS